MRLTATRTDLPSHYHWAVTPSWGKDGPWLIQHAYRQGLGTRYDPPNENHTGFRTKREATVFKRRNLSLFRPDGRCRCERCVQGGDSCE